MCVRLDPIIILLHTSPYILFVCFPVRYKYINIDDNSAATTQMAQSEAALILPRGRSKWLKIYSDELGGNGHRQKEITVPSMMNQCFNIGSIFFSSWMVLRSVAE